MDQGQFKQVQVQVQEVIVLISLLLAVLLITIIPANPGPISLRRPQKPPSTTIDSSQ